MKNMSVTELRTRSKELIKTLQSGKSVDLLYRSRVIGVFKPVLESKNILTNKELKEIDHLIEKIKPNKLIPKNKRQKTYISNLKNKYGQNISRHKPTDRYLGA